MDSIFNILKRRDCIDLSRTMKRTLTPEEAHDIAEEDRLLREESSIEEDQIMHDLLEGIGRDRGII